MVNCNQTSIATNLFPRKSMVTNDSERLLNKALASKERLKVIYNAGITESHGFYEGFYLEIYVAS